MKARAVNALGCFSSRHISNAAAAAALSAASAATIAKQALGSRGSTYFRMPPL